MQKKKTFKKSLYKKTESTKFMIHFSHIYQHHFHVE